MAALIPAGVYVLVLVLSLALPGRWVDGYVTGPDGTRLRYRLNGLRVFFVVVGLWAAACANGLLAWDTFWTHRWAMAAGACVLGLLFSAALVLPAPSTGKPFLADFYLGRIAQPQWGGGRVDAKMYLYLIGAVLLELNLLSFAAAHVLRYGQASNPGVFVHVGLFTFFLCEYLFFEEVHLYTYDFVAERVGFKLGWGCFVFYPFFYAVALWATAELGDPQVSPLLTAAAVLLFFSGWVLSRGANLQKYWFKKDPERKAFGVLAPQALTGQGKRVLISGFWGLSRHVNYLGEVLMASGLSLALGWPGVWAVWLYPLYYVALLWPRQWADDARCQEKYGPLWAEYVQRVPYRIIPFVY